jgi:CubicO group peptidase (beta-lactamase class C family)
MQDLGALDAFAARVLTTGTATGLAVALTDRERTLAARVYGDAAPDHLWPIASIGKSFTAALAVMLADEGALDLHARSPITSRGSRCGRGSPRSPSTTCSRTRPA